MLKATALLSVLLAFGLCAFAAPKGRLTNAERFKRGLPPNAPRRRYDPTRVRTAPMAKRSNGPGTTFQCTGGNTPNCCLASSTETISFGTPGNLVTAYDTCDPIYEGTETGTCDTSDGYIPLCCEQDNTGATLPNGQVDVSLAILCNPVIQTVTFTCTGQLNFANCCASSSQETTFFGGADVVAYTTCNPVPTSSQNLGTCDVGGGNVPVCCAQDDVESPSGGFETVDIALNCIAATNFT